MGKSIWWRFYSGLLILELINLLTGRYIGYRLHKHDQQYRPMHVYLYIALMPEG